jgi:hypothetical protein
MVHAVFLNDPDRMRHQLELSNWELDVAVPADAFASSNAASAKRIQFAHPHPQPRADAKPEVQGKPPKTQQQ